MTQKNLPNKSAEQQSAIEAFHFLHWGQSQSFMPLKVSFSEALTGSSRTLTTSNCQRWHFKNQERENKPGSRLHQEIFLIQTFQLPLTTLSIFNNLLLRCASALHSPLTTSPKAPQICGRNIFGVRTQLLEGCPSEGQHAVQMLFFAFFFQVKPQVTEDRFTLIVNQIFFK